MRFHETTIQGCWLIEIEPRADSRGSFAVCFAEEEFAARGLNVRCALTAASRNTRKGTLRGMHYQVTPHMQSKLVRCVRGAIHDVAIDLRRDSTTFGRWFGADLTAGNLHQLYIPEGCAHGFITLEDDSEVLYQISAPHSPTSERGVRWDDPVFKICWPMTPQVMNDRDRTFPLFDPAHVETASP